MRITLSENALYGDLVNNFELFHNNITTKELAELPNWKDTSDYSHFPHIDDFLEDVSEDDMEKSHIVRCPIKYIFSSEESLGGFDRPIWANTKGDPKCRSNLNILNGNGKAKGYVEADAGILAGYLRPYNGEWNLVKYIGNNRVRMKLLANRGENTEVLIEIRFHTNGLSLSEYIQLESERHTTDAGDRSGQNEVQKFTSAFRSKRSDAVECFDFLINNKLDFNGIMKLEGIDTTDFLEITSLGGIKDGRSNGYFRRFGEINVQSAVGTIHRLAHITNEKNFGSSQLIAFSMMFKCFTEYGKKHNSTTMMFTREELQNFFVEFYTEMNSSQAAWKKKKTLLLSDLNASGTLKDMAYMNVMTFWPAIVEYWMHIREAEIGFRQDCYAITQLLKFSNNEYLRKEMITKVQL